MGPLEPPKNFRPPPTSLGGVLGKRRNNTRFLPPTTIVTVASGALPYRCAEPLHDTTTSTGDDAARSHFHAFAAGSPSWSEDARI
ncbi:hypothetical protein ACCO45_001969 [Purpureocillium lilacinum]|uniref:Uncharacterized protein n=1 Tax=Purpureocillium lilacinum TaxID=33203 RepID=A0ACC4E8I3_PURLI